MNRQATTFKSNSFKSEPVKPTSFTDVEKDEPIRKEYIFIRQGLDKQCDLDFSKRDVKDKNLSNSELRAFDFLINTIASGLRWILIISMLYVGVPITIGVTEILIKTTFSVNTEYANSPATEKMEKVLNQAQPSKALVEPINCIGPRTEACDLQYERHAQDYQARKHDVAQRSTIVKTDRTDADVL